MAHATGSRRQLVYGKETNFKELPTSGKIIRNTGDSINLTKNALTSSELSGDRTIRFMRHGNQSVAGDVSFEFAYADFEDMMASALASTWTADVSAEKAEATLTLGATVADGDIVTIGTDVYEFVETFPYTAGNIVVDVSGSLLADDALDALVLASAGGTEPITIVNNNDGTALVEATEAGEIANLIAVSTTITGGSFNVAQLTGGVDGTVAGILKQGTENIDTYTFEKGFQDISQYIAYTGCAINTFSLDMSNDSIITGSVGVVGAGANLFTDESSITDAPTEASSNDPFTSHQTQGVITIGDSTACIVTAFSLSIDNGITANYTLCGPQAISMTPDNINITGSITALFEDKTEVERFIKEEAFVVKVKISDPDGNAYEFIFPNVKYTGGEIPVSGGGVISISLPFQALYDETEGSAIVIKKTDA